MHLTFIDFPGRKRYRTTSRWNASSLCKYLVWWPDIQNWMPYCQCSATMRPGTFQACLSSSIRHTFKQIEHSGKYKIPFQVSSYATLQQGNFFVLVLYINTYSKINGFTSQNANSNAKHKFTTDITAWWCEGAYII
jgi:hypothetical protein